MVLKNNPEKSLIELKTRFTQELQTKEQRIMELEQSNKIANDENRSLLNKLDDLKNFEDIEYPCFGEVSIGKTLSTSKIFKSNIFLSSEITLQQQVEIKYPNKSVKAIEEVCGIKTTKGSLDLSAYPNLVKFTVFNNITNINISKNTKLETLELPHSEISNIDLSNNPYLQRLQLGNEKLTFLDLSKNPKLKESFYGTDKLILSNLSKDSIIFSEAKRYFYIF
ncbi:7993_t:CDS:2 [Funneliformis geosporum]|nr:7993_t:CDS:2 [Funneliformis geosporum]